ELTHRERQMAVRAAVLERDRRAVLQPVEHDRLPENGAAERLSPDLAIVGGDVPIILEEHGAFLRAWRCVFPCGGWWALPAAFSMRGGLGRSQASVGKPISGASRGADLSPDFQLSAAQIRHRATRGIGKYPLRCARRASANRLRA